VTSVFSVAQALMKTLKTDILILGSGGAGLFAALHAHQVNPDLSITVAVKGLLGKSGCTRMVQGGYNVALSPGDSVERHFMDTIEGGKWLPDQELAWMLVAGAVERIHELADGSVVRLGPRSAIDVAITAGERRVRLLQGRAFFEVAPDAARPFRVVAGGVEATVLGTAFEVVHAAAGIDIAVREGRVRVAGPDNGPAPPEPLAAGQWLRVGPTGAARGARPAAQIAAWLDGQLVVRDRPLGEVVEALEPWYGGVILLTDRELAGRRLTGVYNLSDPVGALQAIAAAHGAIVRRLSPWVLLVSPG